MERAEMLDTIDAIKEKLAEVTEERDRWAKRIALLERRARYARFVLDGLSFVDAAMRASSRAAAGLARSAVNTQEAITAAHAATKAVVDGSDE